MQDKTLQRFIALAAVVALFVVMLGAYTRLTDAGLGCPDWPGCYGKMLLSSENQALMQAQQAFPDTPIETTKAWTEMAHRYGAGSLGLLILLIAVFSVYKRLLNQAVPLALPIFLVSLLIFQALLGMWTVTLKLLPLVVIAHLLGGMLIFASLCRLWANWQFKEFKVDRRYLILVRIGLFILFMQLALGGLVSANYAGIACIGFPTCNGSWWPGLHFASGFSFFSQLGINYQGGVLEADARASIQFIHRLGAVLTLVYLLTMAALIYLKSKAVLLKNFALLVAALVCLQFSLGVMNVLYLLPIEIAVLHNGVAALLLATLFSMLPLTLTRGVAHAD